MSNNIVIPATGSSGTANPTVEAYDTTGSNGPQRQSVTIASVGAPGSIVALGATPAGGLLVGGKTTNPTSTLTRPSNTTAYTAGQLVASSTTAGSITVPSFTAVAANGGGFHISYLTLSTNKTSGMGAISLQVNLWSAAPTYTTGDGTTYTVATGAASWLGSFTIVGLTQFGDGAVGAAVPDIGTQLDLVAASGASVIYWDITAKTGFTPASAQTFTITPAIIQD